MAAKDANTFELIVLVGIVAIVAIVGVFGFIGLQLSRQSDLAGAAMAAATKSKATLTQSGDMPALPFPYKSSERICYYQPTLICDGVGNIQDMTNGTSCYNTTVLVCDHGESLYKRPGTRETGRIT